MRQTGFCAFQLHVFIPRASRGSYLTSAVVSSARCCSREGRRGPASPASFSLQPAPCWLLAHRQTQWWVLPTCRVGGLFLGGCSIPKARGQPVPLLTCSLPGPIPAGVSSVLPILCTERPAARRCQGGTAGPHLCFRLAIPQMTPTSTLFIAES